jgi:hypothetical protein
VTKIPHILIARENPRENSPQFVIARLGAKSKSSGLVDFPAMEGLSTGFSTGGDNLWISYPQAVDKVIHMWITADYAISGILPTYWRVVKHSTTSGHGTMLLTGNIGLDSMGQIDYRYTSRCTFHRTLSYSPVPREGPILPTLSIPCHIVRQFLQSAFDLHKQSLPI